MITLLMIGLAIWFLLSNTSGKIGELVEYLLIGIGVFLVVSFTGIG